MYNSIRIISIICINCLLMYLMFQPELIMSNTGTLYQDKVWRHTNGFGSLIKNQDEYLPNRIIYRIEP
jgi:hypothetical protein